MCTRDGTDIYPEPDKSAPRARHFHSRLRHGEVGDDLSVSLQLFLGVLPIEPIGVDADGDL